MKMIRRVGRLGLNFILAKIYWIKAKITQTFFLEELISKKNRVHLGCGDVHLDKFINVDTRATKAADIVHDCIDLSFLPRESISFVFANAFFEHVYRLSRVRCLLSIRKILKPNGLVLFLAIPDFESIARNYLKKSPGIVGKTFDLFNVYRYTHGDPEQSPTWWIEQLHKSLFDKDEVIKLLKLAGFTRYTLFSYKFRDDKLDVSLAFIAGNKESNVPKSKEGIIKILNQVTKDVNLKSVKRVTYA